MTTQTDSPNTSVLWTIVLVGTFAMISISAAVTAMVRAETNKLDGSRPRHADVDTVVALKRAGRENLAAGPAWVDKATGAVKVPINVAKQLVVKELQGNPAAASPPPPPGLNMAAAAGSGPTASAAGAAPGAVSSPAAAAATDPAPRVQ